MASFDVVWFCARHRRLQFLLKCCARIDVYQAQLFFVCAVPLRVAGVYRSLTLWVEMVYVIRIPCWCDLNRMFFAFIIWRSSLLFARRLFQIFANNASLLSYEGPFWFFFPPNFVWLSHFLPLVLANPTQPSSTFSQNFEFPLPSWLWRLGRTWFNVCRRSSQSFHYKGWPFS